jgi:multiple antibiotic resistance protein
MFVFGTKAFISILTIMGPFTVLPAFVSMTQGMSQTQRNKIAKKSMVVSASILIVSTLIGEALFELLGISLSSFRIAGGILILIMGINMLHAKRSGTRATEEEISEGMEKNDISVFPLGTPLIAGPGAISTVILFSTGQHRGLLYLLLIITAVLIASAIFYYLLRYSHLVYKAIGHTGANIMTRLMGLVLSAMAVEFIIDGIKQSLNI